MGPIKISPIKQKFQVSSIAMNNIKIARHDELFLVYISRIPI
jgi:hypothetical protein